MRPVDVTHDVQLSGREPVSQLLEEPEELPPPHELDQQRIQAQPEIRYAKRRVDELDQERRRLAHGVITGAIPEELVAEEQDQISKELAQARRILGTAEIVFAKIEDTLNRALALVGRCNELYRLGGPEVRRLSNQFFFDKLLIDVVEDEATITGAEVREPWTTVLNPSFHRQMAANTKEPRPSL